MPISNRLTRCAKAVALAAAITAATAVAPAIAQADPVHHYYIELGGTGSNADAPTCTNTYYYANQHLDGGIAVPVCYPASAGPWLNGHNAPDLTAPSYDSSVGQGYQNLLATAEDTYHKDPGARFTIVGYSQGAQAADQLLETIAGGGTDIPQEQVEGKLYADPKQPDTGLWAKVPKGLGALGFTSAGAGPKDFSGIPVARYCIHKDMACDATTPVSAYNFFLTDTHRRYAQDGNVMTQTIAHDGENGVFWYDS